METWILNTFYFISTPFLTILCVRIGIQLSCLFFLGKFLNGKSSLVLEIMCLSRVCRFCWEWTIGQLDSKRYFVTGFWWVSVCIFSGPSSVVLDNADRAVATITKLVVGVYEFKLTVKDNEGLEGSSTVKLTVKQSMFPHLLFLLLF